MHRERGRSPSPPGPAPPSRHCCPGHPRPPRPQPLHAIEDPLAHPAWTRAQERTRHRNPHRSRRPPTEPGPRADGASQCHPWTPKAARWSVDPAAADQGSVQAPPQGACGTPGHGETARSCGRTRPPVEAVAPRHPMDPRVQMPERHAPERGRRWWRGMRARGMPGTRCCCHDRRVGQPSTRQVSYAAARRLLHQRRPTFPEASPPRECPQTPVASPQ